MTLPNWLEPVHARITIPVMFALGYALYHWLKWRYEKAKQLREEEVLHDHPIAAERPASEGTVASTASIQPPPVNHEDPVEPSLAAEAERLWIEACGITHQEAADFSTDWHYLTLLYQSAELGSLLAMSKLGDHAYAREDLVEAFYWKLMLELRHGKPSGLPAQGVCRFWQDVGCPEPTADEGGSFTENQSRLAMAVLDLWSGRHVHTPKETIRQMVEEGDKDALLCAKRLGIGRVRS